MASQVQQQYKTTQAYITSEQIGEQTIDVRQTIVEISLFEDLEKPYITGQIVLSDDAGIYDNINFNGTERLFIEMASEDETLIPVMSRSFIMYSIEKIIKSSESGASSIYVFNIIDEHAIASAAKKISRTVRGTLEDEIQRICTTDLSKDVDVSYLSKSMQSNFKINIPYLHPLDACEWLRQRATTEDGLPLFLYASIHDTRLRLGDLGVMLSQQAWNTRLPYLFAPSNVQLAETQTPLEKTMVVQAMRSSKLQDTRKLIQSGSIGALYNNTNLTTGRIMSTKFDVTTLLANMQSSGAIPQDKTQNVYNDKYVTEQGISLHEQNAKVYHGVTSQGVYDTFKSYHDELDGGKMLKKIESKAACNLLYKNMFDVTVPGAGFIVSKASVGDIVKINVLNDNNDPDQEEKFDRLRSGNFLIYNTRHVFRDTRHDVVMTVCKLTRN